MCSALTSLYLSIYVEMNLRTFEGTASERKREREFNFMLFDI